MIKCTQCNTERPGIKKEHIGILLVLIVVPYIYLFGIYASTIIWAVLFLGTGIYLIVKRPSKNFICKNCIETKKNISE